MINTRKEFEKIKSNKTYGYSNFIQQQIRSKGIWDYKIHYKQLGEGRKKMVVFMHKEDWDKAKEVLI